MLTWQIGFSSLRTSHCKVLRFKVLEVDRFACCRMGQFDFTLINRTFNRKRWDGRVSMQAWTTYKFCILWYSSLQVTHIQAKLWNSCCYIQRTNAEQRVKVCAHILLVITFMLTWIDDFAKYIDSYAYPNWKFLDSVHTFSHPGF